MRATPRPRAKGQTLAWGRYSSWAPVGLVGLGRRRGLGRVAGALLQPEVGAARQGEHRGQGEHHGAGLLVGGRAVDDGDDGEDAADHQEQPQGHGAVVDPPAALVPRGLDGAALVGVAGGVGRAGVDAGGGRRARLGADAGSRGSGIVRLRARRAAVDAPAGAPGAVGPGSGPTPGGWSGSAAGRRSSSAGAARWWPTRACGRPTGRCPPAAEPAPQRRATRSTGTAASRRRAGRRRRSTPG